MPESQVGEAVTGGVGGGAAAEAGPQDRAERRVHPRHVALENRVEIGWGAGDAACCVAGHLLDISRGGARLEAVEPPPDDGPVSLRLHAGEQSWAIAARALETRPGRRLGHLVRLAFDEPCPDDLYKVAVCGHRAAPDPRGQGPSRGAQPALLGRLGRLFRSK